MISIDFGVCTELCTRTSRWCCGQTGSGFQNNWRHGCFLPRSVSRSTGYTLRSDWPSLVRTLLHPGLHRLHLWWWKVAVFGKCGSCLSPKRSNLCFKSELFFVFLFFFVWLNWQFFSPQRSIFMLKWQLVFWFLDVQSCIHLASCFGACAKFVIRVPIQLCRTAISTPLLYPMKAPWRLRIEVAIPTSADTPS